MSSHDNRRVRALFKELDQRHFAGNLTLTGFRVNVCNLMAGEVETYIHPDGSQDSFLIEEDNLRGVMIFEGRLILVSHHDQALLPSGRDPAVELRNTLLHEMAHAAVDLARPLRKGADPHGRRFVLQLRRLEAAGESSLREQVRFYSMTPFCRLLASLL
jgi:hypothetical protein